VQAWEITWRPGRLSPSFHGRDLFAPVTARLARGEPPPGVPRDPVAARHPDWPDDLAEIVYVDHYGNAVTGLRTALLSAEARLTTLGRTIGRARTLSDVPVGTAFLV
jgi:S-adenosylmethionine hydrolase